MIQEQGIRNAGWLEEPKICEVFGRKISKVMVFEVNVVHEPETQKMLKGINIEASRDCR